MHAYMIDNLILLITGTLHERDIEELLTKCHPLGEFDAPKAVQVCESISELYKFVIADLPLAPYFKDAELAEGDLGETNIEIIRNTLYKAWLEQFYQYCQGLGGITAEVMGEILSFEADRRAINITINSFGTELSKEDREALYPNFGSLWPEGTQKLSKADDVDGVRTVCEAYAKYSRLFEETGYNNDKSLEDNFFEMEVKLNQLSFEQQMHYGVFYSWVRLKEQEIRNIVWIAECVSQRMKDKINNYIPIFKEY